jgi:hypothetical protein
MTCEAAREGLSALVRGPIGLTDWALLEAHLRQCAPCRQAEAHLRQLAVASHPVTSSRGVRASLRKAMELVRIGAASSTALVASALADFGLGIARVVAEVAHLLRASMAIPLMWSVAVVNALEAVRRNIGRSVRRTIRFRPSVQAVGAVLALAFTVCALRGADGPQQLEPARVASAPLEPTRLEPPQAAPVLDEPAQAALVQTEPAQAALVQTEPAQTAPVQPASSLPAPSVEKKTVSGGRRQVPSEAPPRAAPLAPPDVSASELVREVVSSPPTLLSEPPVSAAHVVGQLSPKNPRAAQRAFFALLADVGGTELGRSDRVRFTAVDVVVPQSRYSEFADGLARIGSWRVEAARVPLPDAVHMTIRVSE